MLRNTIFKNKALFQGDPSAPLLFNHTLDRPLFEFWCLSQKNKWGIPVKHGDAKLFVSIFAFADNYWLLATSPAELQSMLPVWLSLLRKHGWNTPAEEVTYCTTALDSDYLKPLLLDGHIIKRAPRKSGFKVLGTYVTCDVCDDIELNRRISSAWASFFKFKPILLCKAIALRDRFKAFRKAIHPALFWCAGSWTLRVDQLSKLRGVQRSMIRKMLHFKFRGDEDMQSFYEANRVLHFPFYARSQCSVLR